MDSGEMPIGRQVARWRVRRRMTQQMLADRIGKSKSWVDKVERGVRALHRFPVIQEIGAALRVDPLVLLGLDVPPPSRIDAGMNGVDTIRTALARYEVFRVGGPGRCPPAHEVEQQVEHAWLTYQHGHYPQVVRALPGLLDAAQRLHAVDRVPGSGPLVQVYRIAASVLVKLGEADLAWLAADRAMATAAADPMLAATAAVHLAQALRALNRPHLALTTTLPAIHSHPTGLIMRFASPNPAHGHGYSMITGAGGGGAGGGGAGGGGAGGGGAGGAAGRGCGGRCWWRGRMLLPAVVTSVVWRICSIRRPGLPSGSATVATSTGPASGRPL
ncbi:helix-turn-helix domain-containing protein [Micromonospora fluostatini]|uniref:helix-turn-helix domain-containing protein n=1 Tax=Micromonospora sp. JCM 30529 TaxID=3421643 RepID=UPI003D17B029